MNNVRTVSDTKRAFYSMHTRPINSIYRRVVEELMVEMHLLSVNVDFRYDPFYALGVVTSYERFMQGYRPEQDKTSIFEALCRANEGDPGHYRHDAERLAGFAKNLSAEELISWLSLETPRGDDQGLGESLQAIANHSQFKYSRLFAIGLFTLVEQANPDLVKDEAQRTATFEKVVAALHLPADKLQKDLELYRSNLEKLTQARIVMEDILKADRKKREEREQAQKASETSSDSQASTSA